LLAEAYYAAMLPHDDDRYEPSAQPSATLSLLGARGINNVVPFGCDAVAATGSAPRPPGATEAGARQFCRPREWSAPDLSTAHHVASTRAAA
jgi:hypothetical protein